MVKPIFSQEDKILGELIDGLGGASHAANEID